MRSPTGALGANKMKLGVFASNLDGGFTATTVEERHRLSWEAVRRVAVIADRSGFELQVPLARWQSLGGLTEYQGNSFEPLTWAAGLAAVTERSNIFATVHVPLIHPVLAAKQMTTIDQISGGRFGVNIVCGWDPRETAMFGLATRGEDEAYAYAGEWLDIVERLWTTDDEFDYEGTFFQLKRAWQKPNPARQPRPLIMNAGSSHAGARFAAGRADLVVSSVIDGESFETTAARFNAHRQVAREDFGREIEVWSSCFVICRETDQEARDYYDWVIHENGDVGVLDGLPPAVMPDVDGLDADAAERLRYRLLAAFGAHQLVGTPEHIVSELVRLSDAGLDGVILSWVNFEEGVKTWIRDVLPLMEHSGLRAPIRAAAAAGAR